MIATRCVNKMITTYVCQITVSADYNCSERRIGQFRANRERHSPPVQTMQRVGVDAGAGYPTGASDPRNEQRAIDVQSKFVNCGKKVTQQNAVATAWTERQRYAWPEKFPPCCSHATTPLAASTSGDGYMTVPSIC